MTGDESTKKGSVSDSTGVRIDAAGEGRVERRRAQTSSARKLTARYAFMLDLNDRLHGITDMFAISGRACEMLGQYLEAGRVIYAEVDDDDLHYEIVSEWTDGTVAKIAGTHRLDEYGEKRVSDFNIGRIWRSDDTFQDSTSTSYIDLLAAADIRAHIGIPIAHAGRVSAILCVHTAEPRKWSDAEIELIAETALRTSEAVERARVEHQLRLSEERYSALVHAGANSVWRMSADGSEVITIQGPLQHRSRRDLKSPNEWVGELHPDDRAETVNAWKKAVRNKEFFDQIQRIKHDDSGYRYIHARGVPVLDDDGGVREWIGTAVDVTEHIEAENDLRRSEERLRLLTESFTDYAIFTLDLDRRILTWNPGAVNVFGFTEEEAIGQLGDIIFTPEDITAGQPENETLTAREEGRATDERWHIRKDGSRFFASGVMASLFDGETLIGYAKIARDLTERKAADEELKKAREDLEMRVAERTKDLNRSNNALREEIRDRRRIEEERLGLLRKIVTTQEDERRRIARDLHDSLGQRLTALRLKIASLKVQCSENSEMMPQIRKLEELGAQLDSEVNFLAWELRPTALDDLGLVNALQNYVRNWSSQYEMAGEFHTTGNPDRRLDEEVETNLYRITQEALNNVYKHSRAESISVILEFRDSHVELIVEDNGLGFAPQELSRVRESGRGLGLIGMRERAAIVGGTVEIESTPGSGTTIYVRVPIKQEPNLTA